MNTIFRFCRLLFVILPLFTGGSREVLGQILLTPVPGYDLRIDPEIRWAIYSAKQTLANPESSAAAIQAAQAALDEKILVIFDYSAPIPLLDLASFVNDARGEITWIFRSSYGWTGNIARGSIPDVVASLSSGLRAVIGSQPITIDPPPPVGGFLGEILLPPVVEVAATVDGPFSPVTANWDFENNIVTVLVENANSRFFRLQARTNITLLNAKIAGDWFVFSYKTD